MYAMPCVDLAATLPSVFDGEVHVNEEIELLERQITILQELQVNYTFSHHQENLDRFELELTAFREGLIQVRIKLAGVSTEDAVAPLKRVAELEAQLTALTVNTLKSAGNASANTLAGVLLPPIDSLRDVSDLVARNRQVAQDMFIQREVDAFLKDFAQRVKEAASNGTSEVLAFQVYVSPFLNSPGLELFLRWALVPLHYAKYRALTDAKYNPKIIRCNNGADYVCVSLEKSWWAKLRGRFF